MGRGRESIGEERLFLPSAELAATIDHLPQRPIHVIIPSRRSEREFEKDGGKWDQQESTWSPKRIYVITFYYAGIILSPSSISIQWLLGSKPHLLLRLLWRIMKNTAKDAGPTRPAHKFRQ